MATIVVCHGAWSAGWAWKKVRPLLRAAGHDVFTPTYTGLGERAHQVSRAINLDTHIADVLARARLRGPARHRARWPQLRRHGGDRRRRPRARSASPSWSTSTRSCPRTARACSTCCRAPARAKRHGGAPRPTATAGCCRPTHRRPIPRPRTWRGSRRGGAGSRPACFTQPLRADGCRPPACRAPTSTARASRPTTPSASSPSASAPTRRGSSSRSTPATAPTSRRPRRWRN